MADNVSITAGSGTNIAADDVAGVMYQRVKLALGADGTAVDAVAGAGTVGTGVQRVTLASDDPAVVGIQALNFSAAVASLAIMDDWDESDRAKVNPIVGQAGVAAGAGAASASTQRVVLASDDAAVASLSVIDDWDESDRAKVNLIVGQAGVAAGAGAVGATVQRMTLASDDPAVTSLAIVDDWDESDRCKTNPIVGQAGIAGGTGTRGATTTRVTIATDDEIVTRSAPPSTGTLSNVAGAATDTTILASNSSRKGATVFNDSTAILYLALANTTSSTTAYSVQIPAGGYYELPVSQGGVYTGVLKGIWASATGNARVTELT